MRSTRPLVGAESRAEEFRSIGDSQPRDVARVTTDATVCVRDTDNITYVPS